MSSRTILGSGELITLSQKNDIGFLTITSSGVNDFSKVLYFWIPKEVLYYINKCYRFFHLTSNLSAHLVKLEIPVSLASSHARAQNSSYRL